MRVDWDQARGRGEGDECYFWRFYQIVSYMIRQWYNGGSRTSAGSGRGPRGVGTYGITIAEAKAKAICLVEVKWIGVEHLDVHLPFFEI